MIDSLDLKLKIYESEEDGDITANERVELLNKVEEAVLMEREAPWGYQYTSTDFISDKRHLMTNYMDYVYAIFEYNRTKATKLFKSSTEKAMSKYMKSPSIDTLINKSFMSKSIMDDITYRVERVSELTRSKIAKTNYKCLRLISSTAKEYTVENSQSFIHDIRNMLEDELNDCVFKARKF